MDAILASLTDEPKHFPDCCCAISHGLIEALLDLLPRGESSLVLSIGAGSGLLEELLRRRCKFLNMFGVEVPDCPNKYLPEDRMLRVPSTKDLHRDCILAETLLFVYPRQKSLLTEHFRAFVRGALQVVLLILNRIEWIEFAPTLESAFSNVEIIQDCGLPAYEVLVMASHPKDPEHSKVAPSVPAAG